MKKGQLMSTQLKAQAAKARSYWERGVYKYVLIILLPIDNDVDITSSNLSILLNGASTWQEYSEAGNAYVHDATIAETLCTPSELKRKKGGELNPNRYESWRDVQARALYQAAAIIKRTLAACSQ